MSTVAPAGGRLMQLLSARGGTAAGAPTMVLQHREALAYTLGSMEERMRVLAELSMRCQEVCSPLYLPTVSRISEELVLLADRLAEGR